MSGCSYTSICPMCGGSIQCYSDYKPYDIAEGECLDCGFYYDTQEGQMSLEEVNQRRLDYDLEPLELLRQQMGA